MHCPNETSLNSYYWKDSSNKQGPGGAPPTAVGGRSEVVFREGGTPKRAAAAPETKSLCAYARRRALPDWECSLKGAATRVVQFDALRLTVGRLTQFRLLLDPSQNDYLSLGKRGYELTYEI